MMEANYISHMGTDLTVVNAARVSFSKESSEFSDKDGGLINYLASHNHWTPFAHPQITIREKVPIFVARQRFKHMVGFTYNEVSRRYVNDTPEFYFPDVWRGKPEGSAKQGSSDIPITEIKMKDYGGNYKDDLDMVYSMHLSAVTLLYESMIESGVCAEQARMVLPQSMYTEYYVTGSLAAWSRAYKQRIDSHAQKEIRDLATIWGKVIQPLFPVSWKALTEL